MPVSLGKAMLHQCSRDTPDAVSDFWEPSEVEVDNLERRLVLYLAALEKGGSQRPPAGVYSRQYIGVISHGIRLIYGNYYAPGFSGDPGTTRPMVICDGGSSLWGGTMLVRAFLLGGPKGSGAYKTGQTAAVVAVLPRDPYKGMASHKSDAATT
jgi:hypothetical protein